MKKVCALLLAVLSLGVSLTHAADAAGAADANAAFKKILLTLQRQNYNAYLESANVSAANASAGITKTQFDAFSAELKVNLDQGYQILPQGEHPSKGYEVYLYRIQFKNGSRDVLGTLTMKAGQVAGFYLQ